MTKALAKNVSGRLRTFITSLIILLSSSIVSPYDPVFFYVLSHLRSRTLNYKTNSACVNVPEMNYFFSRISLLTYKVLINSRKE